jgi:hypothetical protein
MLLAKIALGVCGTMVIAGAYTFREGVLRVDVDENRGNGSHVHFWFPAAAVPMAMHLVPKEQLKEAGRDAGRWMPLAHALSKQLEKYPNAELVEVRDGEQHVQIRTHNGKLLIDVDAPDEQVHVVCPLAMIEDISDQIASYSPKA